MRTKFRLRYLHILHNCVFKCLAIIMFGISICYRYVYILLGVIVLMIFIWWSTGELGGCEEPHLLEHVCQEYRDKFAAGNLCHDLCVSKELTFGSCYSYKDNVKSFKSGRLLFKVASNLKILWQRNRIEEGIKSAQFLGQVEELLQQELGFVDTTALINQLVLDFDSNMDGKMNLGEAQNMWWVMKQPDFLNFYILQDNSAVPHLNGTCGGISIWYYPHMTDGTILYRRTTPWPISLFASNTYRWTLPNWIKRAKIMLSLMELIEELYEKDGVRYHLCNLNGMSLYSLDSYEVVITEDTVLLSSQQIRNRLSNVTCHYAHDCTLTPQCQTTCDYSSRQCSGKVTRPTIALVCDMMEDYLLFDAPNLLKISLNRLVHRCQSLSLYTQKLDLVHSILVLDLKSILWNYIQNKFK